MPTALARAWIDDALDQWHREAQGYGPDPDDAGRDDSDDTQEIDAPVFLPEDDGAADLRGLHLTTAQWDAVDRLRDAGVPVKCVGSHCAHVPMDLLDMVRCPDRPAWTLGHVLREERWGGDDDTEPQYHFRPSAVSGGVFLIFPDATQGA